MHEPPLIPRRIEPDDARACVRFEAPTWGGESTAAAKRGENLAIRVGRFVMAAWCAGMAACSSAPEAPGALDQTLQAIGLQSPTPRMPGLDAIAGAAPNGALAPSRRVALRLHAGDVLNTDADGRSLSIVARIYKLRDKTAFEAAPSADFREPKPAKPPAFFADIVDVKEVVLTPGKQYDTLETVDLDAPYFAVVALFRAPAHQRWRFVFDSKSAAATGVTIGVHACALSVSAGQALDTAPELMRVAGVHCPRT